MIKEYKIIQELLIVHFLIIFNKGKGRILSLRRCIQSLSKNERTEFLESL